MPIYIASVAAIAVKFANLMRSPLIAPTTLNALPNIKRKPAAITDGDLSSFTKNEATTTRKPASGPTDKSISTDHQRDGLPERDEAQRGRQQEDVEDIERRQKVGILAENVESEKTGDKSKGKGWRVVRLQKVPPSAAPRSDAVLQAEVADVCVGFDSGDDASKTSWPLGFAMTCPRDMTMICPHNPSSSAASEEFGLCLGVPELDTSRKIR